MAEGKLMNRWLVVVGALLIQLCLGAIYAWSVFTPGLSATTPKQMADIYGPKQLGIEQAKYDQLMADLKEPKQKLKEITAQIRAEKDEAKKTQLSGQKKALLKNMDAVVLKYVPKDRIESLTYGFTKTQTQAIFAVGLALFAIVMVLAGRLLPKIGPRNLAISGGVLLGLGYVLAGVAGGHSFVLHILFIGAVGGAGIGLAYVVPIAVGMRWFPDKKGLITGLAVAGFGFGAMGWVKLAGAWGHLIYDLGLSTVFMIYGIAFFAAVVVGSLWMVFPPEGWKPAGWEPPKATDAAKPVAGTVDFTSSEMLRTPQFYMILLVFVFSSGAGLMTIGLMKLFPLQALVESGLDPITASGIAGTAMAVFFSLANGFGRIGWGTISDVIGRKLSIVLMCATQGAFVIAFTVMAGQEYLLYLGAVLIGFNFGGNFALFPTITADTFGAKYVGQNYGWVFLAYGIGGMFGPILGGALGDMGKFPLAFTICGVLCLVAAVIAALIRPPHKAESPAPAAAA